jgi:tetratricopeptide (TPR) repeat protein
MNLRPWDLWSKSGEPRPETPEIVATLDHVLEIAPHHPLANHLMIHAVEASLHPDKAEAAADRLRELIPETGHLVHMPSHIDIRLGNYEKAINANKKAVAADKIFVEAAGPGGFMAMYRAHNYHFLVYGAMFDGQSKLALTSARELLQAVPASVAETMPDVLDGFLATPYHVMERFGMWDAILAEPAPDAKFAVTNAMWHFSRGLAYSSLGKLVEAAGELAAYERACEKVSGSATIGNNKAKAVLAVGQSLLTGELAYRAGRADEGFAHLREAVKRDDNLAYDEPWGWMQPVRHALGALLLEAGRVEDARDVYAKDLELHPHNGWALHGLAECQRKLGQADEAKKTEALFNAAWARADIKINASCFCRTK